MGQTTGSRQRVVEEMGGGRGFCLPEGGGRDGRERGFCLPGGVAIGFRAKEFPHTSLPLEI